MMVVKTFTVVNCVTPSRPVFSHLTFPLSCLAWRNISIMVTVPLSRNIVQFHALAFTTFVWGDVRIHHKILRSDHYSGYDLCSLISSQYPQLRTCFKDYYVGISICNNYFITLKI